MNLQKVGKFIAKMRKKVGLTQSDLGEALGVTGKAVSKWERGLNAPDITVLVELSKLLNVTPREILMGEEIENNLSTEDDNEITISSINTYNNYSKKKYMKIIIILVSIIVLIITAFSTTYFITNYNKCFVYKLSSADKNYYLEGLIASNQKESSIVISGLRSSYDGKIISDKVNNYTIELNIDEFNIYRKNHLYSSQNEINYSNFFSNTNVMISQNHLKNANQKKGLEKSSVYLIIIFYKDKDVLDKITIPVKIEKKFSNNKIFY